MKARFLIPALAVFTPAALRAQDATGPVPQVEVWLNDHGTFEQGDRMRVFFQTDMDAYVTVVRVTTEGHVRILFPESPLDNNFVAGGGEYEIVEYGEADYRVYDDPGHGYVFAVASLLPFDYDMYRNGGVWDYHLLQFEGEEDRDPYDTFAHFMDDILPTGSGQFAYQAVGYSVDERNSRFYYDTYRYYAVPHYHDCHVYRAFLGLRNYYHYDYDCGRVGVAIILGDHGHYHHFDYYHYGYRGYSTYYYGAGSVYRYRYVGGYYRHNHGARRIPNHVYYGLGRHSQPNPRVRDTRVDRRGVTPAGRRTSAGSPVRTSAGSRRATGAVSPSASPSRRVTNGATTRGGSSATSPSNSGGRRMAPAQTSSGAPSQPSATRRGATTTTRRSPTSTPSTSSGSTGRRTTPAVRPPNSSGSRSNPSAGSSSGRRTSPTVRPQSSPRPSTSPRTSSGGLSRRQGGSSSSTTRAAPAPRREATPRPSSGRSTTRSTPSRPRSSPSTSRAPSRSTTRSAPSRPRSSPSTSRAPSRSTTRSAPSRSSGSSSRPRPGGGSSRRRPN